MQNRLGQALVERRRGRSLADRTTGRRRGSGGRRQAVLAERSVSHRSTAGRRAYVTAIARRRPVRGGQGELRRGGGCRSDAPRILRPTLALAAAVTVVVVRDDDGDGSRVRVGQAGRRSNAPAQEGRSENRRARKGDHKRVPARGGGGGCSIRRRRAGRGHGGAQDRRGSDAAATARPTVGRPQGGDGRCRRPPRDGRRRVAALVTRMWRRGGRPGGRCQWRELDECSAGRQKNSLNQKEAAGRQQQLKQGRQQGSAARTLT